MGDQVALETARLLDGRDKWIAAYAAWYHHFLAMQPRADHIAVDWAKRMAEASLTAFHWRDDRDRIREAALLVPAPKPHQEEPVPAPRLPAFKPAPKPAPSVKPKPAQLSLLP
jgi:hypothetical protein